MKNNTKLLILIFFVAFSLVAVFWWDSKATAYNYFTEFVAGALGVFLALNLDDFFKEKTKEKEKKRLLTDLKTELEGISNKLTGRGNLLNPYIWDSAISSGQIRLLDSEQARELSSIYREVKSNEYEAIRCRDLGEEFRLAEARDHKDELKGLNLVWGKYSIILRDREENLKKRVDEALKKDWWI